MVFGIWYKDNQEDRMAISSFRALEVWQEAHKLVCLIYKLTKTFPNDKIHFYFIAKGSLTELENQIYAARDVGYLSADDFSLLVEQINRVHRLLVAFTKTAVSRSIY